MVRIVGQWLISRAIERDQPPAAWLRRWIARDERLQRFEADATRLVARLRGDAAAWLVREPALRADACRVLEVARPVRVARRRRRTAWAAAAFATAASVVAVALLGPTLGNQGADALATADLPVAGVSETLTADDGQQLVAAWHVGRAQVEAWHARAASASRRLDDLQWPLTAMRSSAQRTRAESERVRAALDAAVSTQRRELVAGMKSAFTFFSRRLPASVATLVGLQEG